jgi:DNA invertase Pin-like site-specific DNA recombinase
VERTRAGFLAAKRRGQKLGCKPILTPPQIKHARRLIEGDESPHTVAPWLPVSALLARRSGGR